MPYALKYNGAVYYYITNLQGDVMQLVNANGSIVASYDYDPYGKVISATGTMAEINPIRYRGYVYDTESGLYYLQSRYYNPEVGRFLNSFRKSCSLELSSPLSPCTLNPVMVKYVVKNRFPQNPESGSLIPAYRDPSKWFDIFGREAAACGIPP